jgi:hypothetical protein
MNPEYSRDEKGMIMRINMDQISNYFDTVEGDDFNSGASKYIFRGFRLNQSQSI